MRAAPTHAHHNRALPQMIGSRAVSTWGECTAGLRELIQPCAGPCAHRAFGHLISTPTRHMHAIPTATHTGTQPDSSHHLKTADLTAEYMEMYFQYGGESSDLQTIDNGVCDVFGSTSSAYPYEVVTVEEYTAADTPDCDCTGCLCNGDMDETTSDFRACPASCGNGNEGYHTCGTHAAAVGSDA